MTKGSNSIALATLPNVCKMPGPPPPFVPTPLPNIGQSSKQPLGFSTSVEIDGEPVAIRGASFGSSGDIASKASGGGIVSANAEGPTKSIGPGSMDVQIEGKNVPAVGRSHAQQLRRLTELSEIAPWHGFDESGTSAWLARFDKD